MKQKAEIENVLSILAGMEKRKKPDTTRCRRALYDGQALNEG